MANTLANLARMYTETTGTGTLTLTTAVPGFNTFADAGVASGSTITYAIYCGPHREIGQGVYTASGLTLTRATVYSSTNGGAKINLTGRSEVFIAPAKEDFDSFLTSVPDGDKGDITVSGSGATWTIDSNVISAFGRTLTDDADASTARTTLGLGTAATQNTGTSGANVPLMNGANTWSSAQTFSNPSNPLGNAVFVESTEDSAGGGPGLCVRRISTSPAANDQLGFFQFQGRDDAGNNTVYGGIYGLIRDPTNGSEDGGFDFYTLQAASLVSAFKVYAGAVVGAPTGSDQGVGTLNAVTLYENGTSLASKYQGLDSELSAIAGLTSAADRLPYFTGSGTAALATFTTAGRNLVDDADASAQRTTLGLGTAATQNTGTSGANVPLMNGVNTWSGAQTFDYQTHTFTWSDDGAATGPVFNFVRNSASPAIGDSIAGFNWVGKDSAGNNTGYGLIEGIIVDPTNTSEDGRLRFWVYQAGAQVNAARLGLGLVVGAPTGSEKGNGTINAVAVYDDSVLLCAPVEFMKSGTVNTATWDQYTADYHTSEGVIEGEDTIEIDLPEPVQEVVGQRDGTLRLVTKTKTRVPVLEDKPVLDDKGRQVGIAKVPKRTRTPVPEKLVKRKNDLAHEFKAMLDEGFDPRDPKKYFDKMLADEALPGLKTKANWVPNEESNAKRTNRIILALELQTAAFKTVYEQVEALKAEVAELKKAKK